MAEKQLSIKQNMLWNSFGSLVNLGAQWLMAVLLVRLANGYEAAGIFSLAVSVYTIFGSIAQYRMYAYQVSDVKNENTVGEYLSFRFITSAVALALCVAYSLLTCSQDSWLAIVLYGVYRTVMLAIDVFHACDQRHHRMDYIGKSLALQGVTSLVSFIGVFIVSSSLELAILSMVVAVFAVGLLYDLPRTKTLESIVLGISRKKVIYLLISCFSIVLAGVIASATSTIPRQYLSFSMGNEMLGVYASVAAPVAIIQMGASYVYNPLLGYFSEYYAARDSKAFFGLMMKSTLLIAASGVACAIALAFFGGPLLILVFGESIAPHVYLLLPLVVFAVLTGYSWFINDLLIGLRNFKATFLGCVVAFVAVILCMVPLVHLFGMNGVTFAGIASSVLGIMVMLLMLCKQLGAWFRSS